MNHGMQKPQQRENMNKFPPVFYGCFLPGACLVALCVGLMVYCALSAPEERVENPVSVLKLLWACWQHAILVGVGLVLLAFTVAARARRRPKGK